jgi:hypothetical protein
MVLKVCCFVQREVESANTGNKSCKHKVLSVQSPKSRGRQWECEQSKADHWRFGHFVAGALVTWRYILRCAQFLTESRCEEFHFLRFDFGVALPPEKNKLFSCKI